MSTVFDGTDLFLDGKRVTVTADSARDVLEVYAAVQNANGDVEDCWTLRGMADKLAGAIDNDMLTDEFYGSDYRAGVNATEREIMRRYREWVK